MIFVDDLQTLTVFILMESENFIILRMQTLTSIVVAETILLCKYKAQGFLVSAKLHIDIKERKKKQLN